MTQQGKDEGKVITLQWSGDLTVRRMAELKLEVQEALASAAQVSIEMAADAIGDMALLQLLCSAHRTALRAGKRLELGNEPPGQFRRVMDLAGLSRHIGCAQDDTDSCLWKRIYHQRPDPENNRDVTLTALHGG